MGAVLMGGILLYIFFIILFVAGILIIIAGLVFLIIGIKRKIGKTKKYGLQFILASVGIIVGILFLYPIFWYTAFVKDFLLLGEEENVDTGTIIYWQTDKDIEQYNKSFEFFNYNGRIYREFENNFILWAAGDEAIANIQNETQYPWDRYLGRNRTIYTIKNCNDFSLLAFSSKPSTSILYCDVDFLTDKKEYYGNRDNYEYFISKTTKQFPNMNGNEIISRSISRDDLSILENIEYGYADGYIEIPKDKEYQYINIFGKSKDGVGQRLFNDFLADGDILYDVLRSPFMEHGFMVVELSDEHKKIVWTLLE